MDTTPVSSYADFSGLETLKKAARQDPGTAVRAAAQQFESLFTNMLLKTMREASLGEGMGDSESTEFYQGMFDQQLSVQMSQGKGLGLADMLVKQLTHTGLVKPSSNSAANAASAATAPGADSTGVGVARAKPTLAMPGAVLPALTMPGASKSPLTMPATGSVASPESPPAGTAMPVPATTSPLTSTEPAFTSPLDFVRRMAPGAQKVADLLGVPTEGIIAQAALETGWGQHTPSDASGNASNNLFGIKAGASWNGTAVQAETTEFEEGTAQQVQQPFRAYDSASDSMADYAQLLQDNSRYAGALNTGNDVHAFAHALQKAGYATDPNYASKLTAVAHSVRALLQSTHLKSADEVPTQSQSGPI